MTVSCKNVKTLVALVLSWVTWEICILEIEVKLADLHSHRLCLVLLSSGWCTNSGVIFAAYSLHVMRVCFIFPPLLLLRLEQSYLVNPTLCGIGISRLSHLDRSNEILVDCFFHICGPRRACQLLLKWRGCHQATLLSQI